MPKYFAEKVFGHWLYFTSHCILEAMHVHASRDSRLREKGAAKFFVYADGSTRLMEQGTLAAREVPLVQDFIKQHYLEMFAKWSELSDTGFYGTTTGGRNQSARLNLEGALYEK